MKLSTALIFTFQILSVLGGKKNGDNEKAYDVCAATHLGSGISGLLCDGAAIASFVTAGVATPYLAACGAASAVIAGASTVCKGMSRHKRKVDQGNGTFARKNKNREPEVCFDIFLDGVGERCINTRDLIEIGTRIDGSVNCPLIGETKCLKDELFMVCGSDKKWKLEQMCPNGMTCKKVSKMDKSIVCAFNEKSSYYERKFDVGYPSPRMEETARQLFTFT
jgi:hypothetical protein